MWRVQVGATPVFSGRENFLGRRQSTLGQQPLQRCEPLSMVSGLAVFALALRRTGNLSGKRINPFRLRKLARPAQRDHRRERVSLPRLGKSWRAS